METQGTRLSKGHALHPQAPLQRPLLKNCLTRVQSWPCTRSRLTAAEAEAPGKHPALRCPAKGHCHWTGNPSNCPSHSEPPAPLRTRPSTLSVGFWTKKTEKPRLSWLGLLAEDKLPSPKLGPGSEAEYTESLEAHTKLGCVTVPTLQCPPPRRRSLRALRKPLN